MNQWEGKGYQLEISQWVGRLGNHIIQLSNALHVAQKTRSILRVPPHDMFRSRVFDLRSSLDGECNETLKSPFFWPHECFNFPIRHDAVRRQLLQDYLAPEFDRASFLQRVRKAVSGPEVDRNTLLINIRSGTDIFRSDPPPQSDYMQPPLSFYKKIIQLHDYKRCVIVTEADQKNPVIPALLAWNPNISLHQHQDVIGDIRLVLSARHLVLAHSTFSWCLALISRNLRVLHQPGTFPVQGIPEVEIHTYESQHYIEPGTWVGSNAQMDLMISHSTDLIVHKEEMPGDYLPVSCMGLTNDSEQLEKIAVGKTDRS